MGRRVRAAADSLSVEQAKALLTQVDEAPAMLGAPARKTTVFAQNACQHCGGVHSRNCPRVRRIAFRDNGQPAEVEFWRNGDWPEHQVLWLDDVMAVAGREEEQ